MPSSGRHDKGAEIECVYIPEIGSRHAMRLQPGRLHAQLHLLPHRHAGPGAQPDRGRDRRAGMVARDRLGDFPGGSRRRTGSCPPARACAPSPTSSSWGWASRSIISTMCAMRSACLTDGDGLSLSKRRITVSTSGVVPEMARLGRGMRHDARGFAACDQRRSARQAGAAQQEISDRQSARRRAAIIPAPPMRGASRSNT